MFIKLTRRGPNQYVQHVEAYRDATTGRPKQRTVATLGRIDQLNTELKSVMIWQIPPPLYRFGAELKARDAMRAAYPGAAAPSAKTLEQLQTYAMSRATIATDLAEGLRANDRQKINHALTQARQAPGH